MFYLNLQLQYSLIYSQKSKFHVKLRFLLVFTNFWSPNLMARSYFNVKLGPIEF